MDVGVLTVNVDTAELDEALEKVDRLCMRLDELRKKRTAATETVDVEDLAFTIKTLADAACNLRKSGFEGSAYMINDLIQDIARAAR